MSETVDEVIDRLLQTCDCAACERLRRAERRKRMTRVYETALRASAQNGAR